MTWVKLDDNFHWHPKVAPLSSDAYRLYVGALCYCNRFQRSGEVTPAEMIGLARGLRSWRRSVDELVAATLWDITPLGWTIHDYFFYQPDPKKQAAGRLGGQASAQARAQAESEAPAQPPSRPVPALSVTGVIPPVVPLQKANDLTIQSRGWRGETEPISQILGRLTLQPRKESA